MTVAEVLGPIGGLAEHAIAYAEAGLEVFPVNRDKTPLVSQHQATTDTTRIEAWWRQWPHALIGHRLSTHHIVLDVDPRHGGLDTWAALRAEAGPLPPTRGHISGRGDGGGHTWWLRPAERLSSKRLTEWARERNLGHDVGGGRWSPGIDILHRNHRYTILPPSPHPTNGQPYQWIDGAGLHIPPAPLPQLIVDLITDDQPPAPAAPPRDPDPDSIADWYSTTYTWSDLLRSHGWTLVGGDGETDGSRWRHPNATAAYSATLRHGCLFVYSPNTPFKVTEPGSPHGYTLFRAHAVLDHNGDLQAAARAARARKDGPLARLNPPDSLDWLTTPTNPTTGATNADTDDNAAPSTDTTPGSTWQRTNLTDIVHGLQNGTLERPQPTIGHLTGTNNALYYPGRVNGLYGESGHGKSWIAAALASETLTAGGTVAWIDLEEPAAGIVGRLLDLDTPPDAIIDRFAHFAPEESIQLGAALFHDLDQHPPDFVVIDSTGEALTLEGAGPNNDDEVATWFRLWPRRIATRYQAAVLVIDHVTKDHTTRGLFPGGSQRKRAAINGSAFMVDTITTLGRGTRGVLKLTTAKDRQGVHRQGHKAAEFILDARQHPIRWHLEPPAGPDQPFRPTHLMERISRWLEAHPDGWHTTRIIVESVQGKAVHLNSALEQLVAEGYVARRTDGQRKVHRSLKPFSEVEEVLS